MLIGASFGPAASPCCFVALLLCAMRASICRYEGGTRVAMLARLPGVIAAGSSVAYPTSNVDFAPTFLEAAGVAATYGLDGTSWWGAVAGAASAELDCMIHIL